MSQIQQTPANPTWWTDQHASNWDNVKAAMQRDWEQTKSDFSPDAGKELNQGIADTVKQSVGSENIPAPGTKTHQSSPIEAARAEEAARHAMESASVSAAASVINAKEDIARENAALGVKIVDIREHLVAEKARSAKAIVEESKDADRRIADATYAADVAIAAAKATVLAAGTKRDAAVRKWHDAEKEIRYGYSARSQYPAGSVWDDKIEGHLRAEWGRLYMDSEWNASRAGVQNGWNYASKQA